jgi:hypothetical protein
LLSAFSEPATSKSSQSLIRPQRGQNSNLRPSGYAQKRRI